VIDWRVIHGDARERLRELPAGSVQTCVTSPPYWGLRDYGVSGQIGLEPTPDAFVTALVDVFAEVRRVLADDGTCWVNLGDSYCNADKWGGEGANTGKHTREPDGTPASWKAVRRRWASVDGMKAKDLVGIPWRVAFALQADGWYLRSDIIWSKPNPMPESVTDRPTKAHEYIFLFSKNERYFYDADAIKEPYAESTLRELEEAYTGKGRKDYEGAGAQNPSDVKRRIVESAQKNRQLRRDKAGLNDWDKRDRKGAQFSGPMPLHSIGKRDGRHEAIFAPGGRNKRTVWTVATQPYPEAHFATFPEALIEPCILAGSKPGDTVLDPFNGSGTTGAVAVRHQRNYNGNELNADYITLARKRIGAVAPLFAQEVSA
jgi:DNA modification methylase